MDRYRADQKSNTKSKNPAAPTGPGFDSLYASLFGSGDRQNFHTSPATASANIPANSQVPSGGLGQTPNGLSYPSPSSGKWHSSSGTSRPPPQHQGEPYSIGPFSSIWSMKSSDMASASPGVQQQKTAGNWSSETTASSGFHDTHRDPLSTTNGLPFGRYNQNTYGHNDAGFHGDGGRMTTPNYSESWSPCDGVNDTNVTGLADWHWDQGKYSSVQSEHWQNSGPEIDGSMENHEVNEWELPEDQLKRMNREEDLKGMQERKEWKKKKKRLNHPENVQNVQVHKPKPHANVSLNEKVVASFLEKYRDKDPAPLSPESGTDSNDHILSGTGNEVRESQFPSEIIKELGPGSEKHAHIQHEGYPPVVDPGVAVNVHATDLGCHIPGKSPSSQSERCDPTGDHQETTSNVDSSDLRDRIEGREVRSLSDPVTVQEVQQNNKGKATSQKALSNGKIRPGKRKPKLPRGKRKNMSQTEKSETGSCGKQAVQTETKEHDGSIEKNTYLDTNKKKLSSDPSSNSIKSISGEHIVQSSKAVSSESIPVRTGGDSFRASKAQVANSNASCKEAPPRDHVSDTHACCITSSICDECECKMSSDTPAVASPGIVSPSVSVKENTRTEKDDLPLGLSNDKSSPSGVHVPRDASGSKETLEKSGASSKDSERTSTSSSYVNETEKGVCIDQRTPGKNSDGKKNKQQKNVDTVPVDNHTVPVDNHTVPVDNHTVPVDSHTESKKHNSDSSGHLAGTVNGKPQNVSKKGTNKSLKSAPLQNPIPDSNSTEKTPKLSGEIRSGSGSKLPTATGNSNKISDKATSGLKQGQENKNTKDSPFFDPKRIFGEKKTISTVGQKKNKKAEKSTNSTQAERIPQSNHETDLLNNQAKENVPAHATESEKCGRQPDHPALQRSANLTNSVRSSMNEGIMNGTVPSRDLHPPHSQTMPSSSAKDTLASKTSAMKTEPVSSQQHSESTNKPTSPTEPRPSRMYSYKKDDKTGVLRRSSDPKAEDAAKYRSSRKDSCGTQGSSYEGKGERRCSGDSHMDGFHHPFGCSAQCYRRSSSPSNSQSSSNCRPASSSVNQSTGSSASSERKNSSKTEQRHAPHVFPQPGNSSSDKVFDDTAFAGLREGLKNSWLSKEKEKQREDEKLEQERIQREHLKKVRQQQEDQMRQQKKQDQKTQQEKQQASASHTKLPTRATYNSRPKSAEQESKDNRQGTSRERPDNWTNTQQPRSPWSARPEERPRTPSQEDSTEDSDLEEAMARGITDEWWFILGKKLCNGVIWFILFSLLLCLVLLSFVLAFLRDTCKFAYHRGWDLWVWYREKPPPEDEFFRSHQSNQGESGDGRRSFGSNQGHQTGTGGWGSSQGNWSHTGANGSSSSSQGFWGSSQQQEQGARTKPPRKKQTHNIELPSTEHAAIQRLLGCNPGSYYEVVGVAEDASEEDIKKFYRKQCMLVHPDKTDQPRANEAFQILQKAYAILSDPSKRSEYDFELDYKEQMEDKLNDLFKKMSEMANSMPCGVCMRSHRRYETDLPIHAARYCAVHNTRHPVRDGALWKETANLGFKIYVFLCDDDTVYDVTEWAACQNLHWLEANSCRLLCKVRRGGRSTQQRQQPSPGYEEMFDNIFGSGAYRQFQNSANQQGHHPGNSHHGNTQHNSGGHNHGQQGGGGRNRGMKKSRKKKK